MTGRGERAELETKLGEVGVVSQRCGGGCEVAARGSASVVPEAGGAGAEGERDRKAGEAMADCRSEG